MLQLPPMPEWNSLHVLVIHFPIALLLLSPIFLAISAVLAPPKGSPYLIAALITLLLGTASVFIAVSTGHSAAGLADTGGPVEPVLNMHEQLAEETRLVFAGLSIILMGMYTLPRLMRRDDNRLLTSFVPSAFLVLYAVGIVFLINTAYAGSRLVHEFGIHAVFPAAESVGAAPGPSSVTATNR